jgi:hypothetical protein
MSITGGGNKWHAEKNKDKDRKEEWGRLVFCVRQSGRPH